MTRPISYACDPGNHYCECGRCALAPARNIDLDAVANLNRATTATAMCLIFLATVLGVLAVGFWKTEQVHKAIVAERNV
ncbi:hypothetical protein RWA02_17045 [Sinorhizobium meliloti]|uniref:hypothetical protein n=1 Tax=Rhizobium meliloti TaxID=382 RepID=UPI0004F58670|nr:hypothetical protein [Sinorhizobium meliloti]MDX0449138.1 hypothetical protein [Sinorhizobium medicae]TWB00484.1 hypothetical protein FB000_10933 [Ensifer sp. SEMIA 134]TWB35531.1 hypothetical protein FB001_10833 [Ensifer sp. SEMIA 135]AIL99972.1 membrane protein [Sinorhizobium meliloti]MCO6424729.1 hypothetical protein [Sinorhizobium meliloti]